MRNRNSETMETQKRKEEGKKRREEESREKEEEKKRREQGEGISSKSHWFLKHFSQKSV